MAEWSGSTKARSFLSPNVTGAVYSSLDHQVENRLLVDALRIAFTTAGGMVHNYTEITAIETKGDTVTGVRCGEKYREFDVVVLAAGLGHGQSRVCQKNSCRLCDH